MILARVLTGLVAAGVVIAGMTLWRIGAIRRARWMIAVLAAYGACAFLHAALTGIALVSALTGHGLFHRLPYLLQGAFIGGFVVLPLGWMASLARAGIPSLREGSQKRTAYQAVALTTCVALVFTAIPRGFSRFNPQSRVATLDNSLRAIEDGKREAPRDLWDPQYIVERIGRDDSALFAWVRENTFWVPYHGYLRGPAGVLMDRLGNSLDRAVLLATLLRDAGYVVRLAHAQLSGDAAAETLPRLIARPVLAPAPAPAPGSPFEGAIRQLAAQYQLDERGLRQSLNSDRASMQLLVSEVERRVADQTQRLTGLIGGAKFRGAEWNERMKAAVEAARDHWWVQRQDGAAWVDFDLYASMGMPERPLAAPEETVELKEAAVSRAHEIAIRVVAERWRDGVTTERTVLEETLRPADLIGQPIVLQFWPLDWPADFHPAGPDPKQTVRATALEQHKWQMSLMIGSTAAKQEILTDTSDIEDGRTSSNPFAGLGGAVSNAFGGSHRSAAGQTLTAVWIEYESRVPGEPPRTIRRSVFDLLGPAARISKRTPQTAFSDDGKLVRSLSLMMRTEILPLVCRMAPEFVAHLLADSVVSNREVLKSSVNGGLSKPSVALEALAAQSIPGPSLLYTLAMARFDLNRWQDDVYTDRPAILTRHIFPVWRGDHVAVRDATDIVANEIGVDLLAPDAFAVRLEQGVVDTNAERIAQGRGRVVGDASEAFDVSRDWVRVDSPEDSALDGVTLSEDVRQQLKADLQSGYTVILPEKPISLNGEAFAGWWRIDPKTGHALGVASNGWGASSSEHSSILYTIARRWAYGFAFDYAVCLGFAELLPQLDRWWEGQPAAPLGQAAAEAAPSCAVMSIIAAGIFATLPFLAMYLGAQVGIAGGYRAGFTWWLRGMRRSGLRPSPKPPRTRLPDPECPPGPKGEPPVKPLADIPGVTPKFGHEQYRWKGADAYESSFKELESNIKALEKAEDEARSRYQVAKHNSEMTANRPLTPEYAAATEEEVYAKRDLEKIQTDLKQNISQEGYARRMIEPARQLDRAAAKAKAAGEEWEAYSWKLKVEAAEGDKNACLDMYASAEYAEYRQAIKELDKARSDYIKAGGLVLEDDRWLYQKFPESYFSPEKGSAAGGGSPPPGRGRTQGIGPPPGSPPPRAGQTVGIGPPTGSPPPVSPLSKSVGGAASLENLLRGGGSK